ncbi:DUF3575 domain-containing protein [Bacteroides sp. 214]|uniref:DUF3575 domain-containing protein n=1 Tax=Bacteroides sp. 214 TaxID=2302935 RepID=UPI0013D4E777|nr:DUF3575 domain-containing protein [Bacteroides sp. 214]NDW12076.1 DUF3575 domain-containing protein [Bacteroides sp. 214]
MRNKIYVVCLLLLQALVAFPQDDNEAQQTGTRFSFKFLPENDIFYVPSWNNGQELEKLCELISQHDKKIANGEIPIQVTGYCTSLSEETENLKMAKTRSNRVKTELILRANMREENFRTTNHATNYNGMKDVVIVSITIPKKKQEVVVKEVKREAEPPKEEKKEVITVVTEETIETPMELPKVKSNYAQLNLHFNLLHWLTLTPDLGLELTLNQQLTLLVRGTYTDWSWKDDERSFYFWRLNPEVRYYWKPQRSFYTGAEFHTGSFDIKLNDTGRKGDFIGGGLTFGYVLYVNNSLAFDFNLGLGYTKLDYDKYVLKGYNVESRKRNVWGPTQAGVSLVWKICK